MLGAGHRDGPRPHRMERVMLDASRCLEGRGILNLRIMYFWNFPFHSWTMATETSGSETMAKGDYCTKTDRA